jgi:hypothetical protein
MTKQEQINKIRCFLGWFEDNFFDEKYLMEEDLPDGTIKDKWISYLDHPEYLGACEALNELENILTNAS